jgi:hypothetical protein
LTTVWSGMLVILLEDCQHALPRARGKVWTPARIIAPRRERQLARGLHLDDQSDAAAWPACPAFQRGVVRVKTTIALSNAEMAATENTTV